MILSSNLPSPLPKEFCVWESFLLKVRKITFTYRGDARDYWAGNDDKRTDDDSFLYLLRYEQDLRDHLQSSSTLFWTEEEAIVDCLSCLNEHILQISTKLENYEKEETDLLDRLAKLRMIPSKS